VKVGERYPEGKPLPDSFGVGVAAYDPPEGVKRRLRPQEVQTTGFQDRQIPGGVDGTGPRPVHHEHLAVLCHQHVARPEVGVAKAQGRACDQVQTLPQAAGYGGDPGKVGEGLLEGAQAVGKGFAVHAPWFRQAVQAQNQSGQACKGPAVEPVGGQRFSREVAEHQHPVAAFQHRNLPHPFPEAGPGQVSGLAEGEVPLLWAVHLVDPARAAEHPGLKAGSQRFHPAVAFFQLGQGGADRRLSHAPRVAWPPVTRAPDTLILYPASTLAVRDGRVASFDLEGRLLTYFEDGVLYKRALDSSVHARKRVQGRRQRFVLPEEEARGVFARARAVAESHFRTSRGEAKKRLAAILDWTPRRLIHERQRFFQVYKPIAILPPDRYFTIVLQATEGCTWNRCTFCNFYSDRPFSVKDPDAFARHARGVQELLGENARLRKDLFLADGNALALSVDRLVAVMETARAFFPGRPIYGFIDVYTGERHQANVWRVLRDAGLRGVYVGMETGHDPLLAWLNKPGSRKELVAFVRTLKAVGLFVGLIVMVGAGGAYYRAAHFQDTLEALRAMPLSPSDVVFLSPFVEDPGSVYRERREALGAAPLTEAEIEAELRRFGQAVRGLGLRAARYDIREFVY